MEPLILKALFGILGLFGGAAALENMLESYIMDRCPQWAKPMVVPVVSFVFAVVLAVSGGASWQDALSAGFALWGGAVALHNHPGTTSRDPLAGLPLPPPPAEADGVPTAAAVVVK